jgi:hypothetical protein
MTKSLGGEDPVSAASTSGMPRPCLPNLSVFGLLKVHGDDRLPQQHLATGLTPLSPALWVHCLRFLL